MAEPNDLLRQARANVQSPNATGASLSRQELADLVNKWIYDHCDRRRTTIDANYVGKLERGLVRWPQEAYRAALRALLGMDTDRELGFYRPERAARAVDDVNRQEFQRLAAAGTAAATTRPLAALLASANPLEVPSVVGPTEIQAVRTAASLFGTWDHAYGGDVVRPAVTAQLRYSAELLKARCPQRYREELHSAVGLLGHTAGLMAFDAYAR